MSVYTLELRIDASDVPTLRAAQLKITLAQSCGALQPNVIWLAIDPFERNTVVWTDAYAFYASPQQQLVHGAVLSMLTQTTLPVTDAAYYAFTTGMHFTGPFIGAGAPPRGTYQVNNDVPNTQYPALTFGLLQQAELGGTRLSPAPINAAVIPAAFAGQFTPLPAVYVWLQASWLSSTVITQITGNATCVTFSQTMAAQTLQYNPGNGRFVPVLPQGHLLVPTDVPHVSLLTPAGIALGARPG